MALRDILGRSQPKDEVQEPDYVEIDENVGKEEMKVRVKIDTIDSYMDTDKVQEMLRDGTVLLLRVKDFRVKDAPEFKRAVEKLKKTVSANDGDIVGLDEDFLIVTPKFATVYRGK